MASKSRKYDSKRGTSVLLFIFWWGVDIISQNNCSKMYSSTNGIEGGSEGLLQSLTITKSKKNISQAERVTANLQRNTMFPSATSRMLPSRNNGHN